MSERFHAVGPLEVGRTVRLDPAEARHLVRVMRSAVGDELTLFDGHGAEFTARIVAIARDTVDVAIDAVRRPDREGPRSLELAVALPKGDRARFLVEKAVELGVVRLVPLLTRYTAAYAADVGRSKLERTVLEAMKQCGRNQRLEFTDPVAWSDYLPTPAGLACSLFAHPGPPSDLATLVPAARTASIRLAIGPEGGFHPSEVEQALAAGWRSVALGPRILRTETAALALVAALQLLNPPDA